MWRHLLALQLLDFGWAAACGARNRGLAGYGFT
jgi:hypothetical protein